jgi:hypothetical protein
MHAPDAPLVMITAYVYARQFCCRKKGSNASASCNAATWPAPGSEDTELGVLMELEWVMERRKFTRGFKLEAVLIKDRGVFYVQA